MKVTTISTVFVLYVAGANAAIPLLVTSLVNGAKHKRHVDFHGPGFGIPGLENEKVRPVVAREAHPPIPGIDERIRHDPILPRGAEDLSSLGIPGIDGKIRISARASEDESTLHIPGIDENVRISARSTEDLSSLGKPGIDEEVRISARNTEDLSTLHIPGIDDKVRLSARTTEDLSSLNIPGIGERVRLSERELHIPGIDEKIRHEPILPRTSTLEAPNIPGIDDRIRLSERDTEELSSLHIPGIDEKIRVSARNPEPIVVAPSSGGVVIPGLENERIRPVPQVAARDATPLNIPGINEKVRGEPTLMEKVARYLHVSPSSGGVVIPGMENEKTRHVEPLVARSTLHIPGINEKVRDTPIRAREIDLPTSWGGKVSIPGMENERVREGSPVVARGLNIPGIDEKVRHEPILPRSFVQNGPIIPGMENERVRHMPILPRGDGAGEHHGPVIPGISEKIRYV